MSLEIKSPLTAEASLNEELAPGCFGSAAANSPETPECAACAYIDVCGIKAEETINRLRDSLGMSALLARKSGSLKPKKTLRLTPAPAPVVSAVEEIAAVICGRDEPARPAPELAPVPTPVKAPAKYVSTIAPSPLHVSKKGGDLLRSIMRDCPNLLELLRQDLNPFAGKTPAYMSVVCQALTSGGFTRRSLADLFMEKLGWGNGTATSHVSIVVSALPAVGVITEVAGVFILKEI